METTICHTTFTAVTHKLTQNKYTTICLGAYVLFVAQK